MKNLLLCTLYFIQLIFNQLPSIFSVRIIKKCRSLSEGFAIARPVEGEFIINEFYVLISFLFQNVKFKHFFRAFSSDFPMTFCIINKKRFTVTRSYPICSIENINISGRFDRNYNMASKKLKNNN